MSKQETPISLRRKIWDVIFEAETRAGKIYDIILIWVIIASVLVVMLETVKGFASEYSTALFYLEWGFTLFFTIEYILKLCLSRRPLRYAFSFFGIVDLLSCLPTFLTLIPGTSSAGASIRVIRVLRLLRIFRVLKMVKHVRGANVILRGLQNSQAKITVFFFAVFLLAIIMGTLMYVVESDYNDQFSSIPTSVYYAIVSIATVGYGDITPETPTGIVSSAMMKADADETSDACPGCGVTGHLNDAKFCRKCGETLD